VTEEWVEAVQRLLSKQDRIEHYILANLERTQEDLIRAQRKVDRIEESLKKRRRLRGKEAEALFLMRDDPVVLVRTYGSNRDVYHSADRPCGHVGDGTKYDRMLWGQAQAEDKRPCFACGRFADREAYRVRPSEAREAG
jgi:Mg2+ and Co2+ transporter CorA